MKNETTVRTSWSYRYGYFHFVIGTLQYPPKKTKYEEEAEKKELQKIQARKNKKIPGIVNLEDLLSGEYRRKKEAERLRIEKLKETKRKILLEQQLDFVYDDPMYVIL